MNCYFNLNRYKTNTLKPVMLVQVTGGHIFTGPVKLFLDMAILIHLATVSVKGIFFLHFSNKIYSHVTLLCLWSYHTIFSTGVYTPCYVVEYLFN
jgi:hypothetical protein